MKRKIICILLAGILLGVSGCGAARQEEQTENTAENLAGGEMDAEEETPASGENGEADGSPQESADDGDSELQAAELVTEGTEEYRGFTLDNVLHSETEGDIHFNLYVPDSYDGSRPYAAFFTLPGYEGLYFRE